MAPSRDQISPEEMNQLKSKLSKYKKKSQIKTKKITSLEAELKECSKEKDEYYISFTQNQEKVQMMDKGKDSAQFS